MNFEIRLDPNYIELDEHTISMRSDIFGSNNSSNTSDLSTEFVDRAPNTGRRRAQDVTSGAEALGDDFEEIPYESSTLAYSTGIAYSWKDVSFTFAINDLNVNEDSDNEAVGEFTQYGTFTLAWRMA